MNYLFAFLSLVFLASPAFAQEGDPLDQVRQTLVDIEASLRKGDAKIQGKVGELQLRLEALEKRNRAIPLGTRAEKELEEIRRTAADLVLESDTAVPFVEETDSELADTYNHIARLPSELYRTPQLVERGVLCKFRKASRFNGDGITSSGRYPVFGAPSLGLRKALSNACTACGPIESHYETSSCSLVGCYWAKTGDSLVDRELLLPLTPAKCRSSADPL